MAKMYAKCNCCGTVNHVSTMVKTVMPNRGNRNAYMCASCARHNHYYHTENNQILGTEKVNRVFCGIEFETSYTDEYARNIMFEYDMIATNDCSLYGTNTCEYVSGIMQGLNKASKFALTCDALVNGGHMTVNESCGTHFHVSIDSMKDNDGNKTYMNYISRFYHSLFIPLCDAMQANPEKTKAMFGRYFNHYCNPITVSTYADDRYNFINVTNSSNIEFRLNKFVNGKQYQNLMKMEVEMVKCIVTNFCEHFNDTEIDNRRYANMTEYRKHKASVTAKKLVKLFEKYSANI